MSGCQHHMWEAYLWRCLRVHSPISFTLRRSDDVHQYLTFQVVKTHSALPDSFRRWIFLILSGRRAARLAGFCGGSHNSMSGSTCGFCQTTGTPPPLVILQHIHLRNRNGSWTIADFFQASNVNETAGVGGSDLLIYGTLHGSSGGGYYEPCGFHLRAFYDMFGPRILTSSSATDWNLSR